MTILIFGAGAIGGTIGAALALSGEDVHLVARGDHLRALQRDGLRFVTPSRTHQLTLPASDDQHLPTLGSADTVVLATKSQQTLEALTRLRAAVAHDTTPAIVCAQNGVENERLAIRLFADVYGMEVFLPATHLEPGIVEVHAEKVFGLLDVGRYPCGVDDRSIDLAARLAAAGFASSARPDIMAWKYRKLVRNLVNALQVTIGAHAATRDLMRLLRAEAQAVYAAAGITAVDEASYSAHVEQLDRSAQSSERRAGGSTLQSVLRGSPDVETDYLNGEIVLLGRLHGVATPVNALVQRVIAEQVQRSQPPGSLDGHALLARARELVQQTSLASDSADG